MKCIYCNHDCCKKGFYKTTQRYQCSTCKRYQQHIYTRKKISVEQTRQIIMLNNEGVGISSIGRLTGISKSSVVRKIKTIAAAIVKPVIDEQAQEYEMDELQTYAGNKHNRVYIMYVVNSLYFLLAPTEVGIFNLTPKRK